jgi:hypothetical protein
MNAEQRRARFTVVMGVLCLVGFLVLWPVVGVIGATAAFGLFGLAGFTPLMGRRERWDERDHAIARRATIAGAMASYLTFILLDMGTWFVVYAWHGAGTISVHLMGTYSVVGMIVLMTVRGIVQLTLYRGCTEADNA